MTKIKSKLTLHHHINVKPFTFMAAADDNVDFCIPEDCYLNGFSVIANMVSDVNFTINGSCHMAFRIYADIHDQTFYQPVQLFCGDKISLKSIDGVKIETYYRMFSASTDYWDTFRKLDLA